ncbi:efflux RND transporter periplasmic adaptor subunit [Puniceibacterium sp. IMCC21224]|uniref:efflux RND transporter periplasmic adaptor subunit n=1 Tax=Puniceibacterium sp. IMCC21224 TaxID=1618204 RepID=UPI00064E05C4|nr:efflux RND transporter periplasmic adaptor subunit [Puniceibacterium sp. IMCC21224]KMK66783.1 HlyD family secretion protein [Puniceibacterium sp. IMCC21224]
MRLIPIITACLVAALLYAIVIERERLMAFVQSSSPAMSNPDAPAPENDADVTIVATPKATTKPHDGAVAVMARRSVARETDSAVILRGETQALRQVDVLAESSGKVNSPPLRKGAFVDEGDLLCQLDPGTSVISLAEANSRLAEARARIPETKARVPEAEARVEEAKAQLEEAQINANAASKLSQGGFASDTRVANTQAAVRSAEAGVRGAEAGLTAARAGMEGVDAAIQSAEAAVARAQTEIDNLKIHAPFSGLLETDSAELGALLQGGGGGGGAALCATIIQLDPVKLVGFVPEMSVSRVEVGAGARARLIEGGSVEGRVTFLSRSADAVTRTFRVEITVPNPDLAVRAGQTAEIAIAAEGALAHLLPQSALTLDDSGVLGVRTIAADGTALFVPINVLRDTSDGIFVTGLPDTADVIILGQEYVTDGIPVAPSFEEVIQ